MIEQNPGQRAPFPASRQFLPLLLALFVGSGCSGLIYEIVWFQLLQLVIGSSAVSLGVLLGTFMGGICLGSVGLPRLISARRHPLRVYALLELGIGIIGVAVLFAMPYVGRLYTENVGDGRSGIFLRGMVCAICLLPPTVLLGATLPAFARWTKMTPRGVSWLGFFYGGNIAGAVAGCLLAGFYLLRVHDVATATCVAAALNGGVALIAFGLAARTAYVGPADGQVYRRAERATDTRAVSLAIGLSGACALGAEVIWTRQLSLMLGATVYTFSIILAVFLTGLGIGSSAGGRLLRGSIRPGVALGWCQGFAAVGIAWTASVLSGQLPYWPVSPSSAPTPWMTFQFDLMRCVWAILPATVLWGASFPLALAAVGPEGREPGRLVGGVYAANTIGAIAGALGFSVFGVAWLGTQAAQQVLIGLSAAAALVVWGPHLWGSGDPVGPKGKFRDRIRLVALVGGAVLMAWSVPEISRGLIAYGRHQLSWSDQADFLYAGEGMNASVAVSELEGGDRNFHVSGKVVASNEPQDMRLQRMLGHLPALIHPRPRSVLVVGCGAGITAGSFVLHPEVERIVICEIEPLIPAAAAEYFDYENYGVLEDARTEVVLDDARHFLVSTKDRFDIITSDPIHPWVKSAAALYSKEYFELCKQHLNPGGVITQWVPLYETGLDAVKSEVATFFDVFPGGTIWGNTQDGEGYDIVLLGQSEPTRIDVEELQQRLDRNDHVLVSQSLSEVGLWSAVDLLATYAGQGSDLVGWLEDAEINRDRNLRLQYLAGMRMNAYQEKRIYVSLLENYRYPENLFVASGRREGVLRRALEQAIIGR